MNDTNGAAGSEWRADPSGRHQLRFFAEGHGTDLVSDDGNETVDHFGSDFLAPASGATGTALLTRPLESVVGLPAPVLPPPAWTSVVGQSGPLPEHRKRGKRSMFLALLVLIAGLTAAGLVLRGKGGVSADAGYLKALQQQGLSGKFTSDANAIAHGHQVCRQLDTGGDQKGQSEDLVAVNSYCPRFAEGFHVLETVTVDGSFALLASDPNSTYPSITSYGGICNGDNGYSDIQEGTQVLVKNASGELVTSTVLGPGVGGSTFCTFSFSFDVIEGETSYVVSVSHRGELRYTFAQLKTEGMDLTLGD